MHVSTQTIRFWKRIFSYMSAWLSTVSLRGRSKSEFHQTVIWTVQIGFNAYKMLLEPKMSSD